MSADEHLVVAAEHRYEAEPVKGSRFVAVVAPAESPAAADAVVARLRAELPDATHHAWAYRVGRPCERFRFSDDGEPGGSAGRPIYQQLEGHGLTDAVVVVVRWYGGTKLGVGGLVRAYGGAAARALDGAPKRVVVETVRLELAYPYECSGAVQALLTARGLAPVAAEYGERVEMTLELPRRERAAFERELADRTAGRVSVR